VQRRSLGCGGAPWSRLAPFKLSFLLLYPLHPCARRVTRILVHPEYNPTTLENDVSLYFLGGDGIPDGLLVPATLNADAAPELSGVRSLMRWRRCLQTTLAARSPACLHRVFASNAAPGYLTLTRCASQRGTMNVHYAQSCDHRDVHSPHNHAIDRSLPLSHTFCTQLPSWL
jgi:hypothetical protein